MSCPGINPALIQALVSVHLLPVGSLTVNCFVIVLTAGLLCAPYLKSDVTMMQNKEYNGFILKEFESKEHNILIYTAVQHD